MTAEAPDPDALLTMNPFVDVHIHPAPESYPIDVARIEVITVRCPVRGRGLVIRDVTRTGDPALFELFVALVAGGGELALDSDGPLIGALVDIGFLVTGRDVVDWPAFSVPLIGPLPANAGAPMPGPGWTVADCLVFQPAFSLHSGVRWPDDYDEQEGRLGCFAPGPAIWLGDPAGLVEAIWLPPEAAAVADLRPGAPVPPLPPALASALAEVGALVPPGGAPSRLARFAELHAAFAADGHAIARQLLPARELAALRRYYAALLAAGLVPFGDRQMAERYSAYNDPIGRFFHARLAPVMASVVGRPVEPSFAYFFSYVAGAELTPHKDRAQAEFSVTLQIDHAPAPAAGTGWPLQFTFDDGRTASADLAIGDAVLYHGRAVTHHRAPLPAGQRSSVLVLEYVPHDFAGLRI